MKFKPMAVFILVLGLALAFTLVAVIGRPAGAEWVSQRWAGQGIPSTHPGTLKVEQTGTEVRLV